MDGGLLNPILFYFFKRIKRRFNVTFEGGFTVKPLLFTNKDLKNLITPMIIEQLLAVLVGLADTIMVAVVGESAVASVSLVDNINILLIGLFMALATGGAVVAGQLLGHGDKRKAVRASEQLLLFMTAFSLLIMLAVYLGKWFILHIVFGQIKPDVMAYADTYLMIVTASIPFIAVYNAGAAIFRVQGNSAVSMKVSILMNGINVAGNAIFVLGFHSGVEGVAIPTLVSRIVAAVMITGLLFNQNLTLHLSKTMRLRFDWGMIRRILRIGIPNGVENSMFQLGKLVLLSLISTFGTAAITANAVSNTVAAFAILPGQAIGMGLVTVASRCVGAGDYEQVRYYTKKLMKYAICAMAVTNLLVIAAIPLVTAAYQLSPETAGITKQILLFHSLCAILIWTFSFTLPNALRAANDVTFAMIVSLLSMWFCRIVMGVVFGSYLGLGVLGVWIAMILDWCVRSIFFLIRYHRGKWEEKVKLM